ncbi:MAG: SCO family protein [Acetobacteraceae bacterium]
MNAITERRTILGMLGLLGPTLLLAECGKNWKLDHQGIAAKKNLPPLQFTLTDADTGKTVTAAGFRGKIVMLYFGYTNCPNVCPLTLGDSVRMFHIIGRRAGEIRFLLVTVDPQRDTIPILRKYTSLFGSPNLIGLRGGETELHEVASRYHAGYSVHPSPDPAKYTVTHTAAVYVFNRQRKPEFIIAGMASPHPDLKRIAGDLRHLAATDRP